MGISLKQPEKAKKKKKKKKPNKNNYQGKRVVCEANKTTNETKRRGDGQ